MLFLVYLDLYRNRELFARTYGPIGNARHVDAATLRWLGNETLRRIDVTTLAEFENQLAASRLGTPQYYDLYAPDGSLKPELATFVSECLEQKNDPTVRSSGG